MDNGYLFPGGVEAKAEQIHDKEQCILTFIVHMNHSGNLKCNSDLGGLEGLKLCISNKLPSDDNAKDHILKGETTENLFDHDSRADL